MPAANRVAFSLSFSHRVVTAYGEDHSQTVSTRKTLAIWTGWSGDPRTARQMLEDVLTLEARRFAPGHPGLFDTRSLLAFWTQEAGDARIALTMLQELLPEEIAVLGADDRQVLADRRMAASCFGQLGWTRLRPLGSTRNWCQLRQGFSEPSTQAF